MREEEDRNDHGRECYASPITTHKKTLQCVGLIRRIVGVSHPVKIFHKVSEARIWVKKKKKA